MKKLPKYAYDLKPGASANVENKVITVDGILRAEHGAKVIKLKNVGAKHAVRGQGQYHVGIFNKPVERFEWDNTKHFNDPDWWICSSTSTKKDDEPGEAALRFDSLVRQAIIRGVMFRCGKWTDKNGRRDWWKQAIQIRYTQDTLIVDSLIIGPWAVGRQDRDKLGQVVELLTLRRVGLTHKPTLSKTRSSVKKIVFIDCYYIDESGKPTGKKFPNQTW